MKSDNGTEPEVNAKKFRRKNRKKMERAKKGGGKKGGHIKE